MEGPYITNDVQTEYSIFCNSNNTSCNVSINFKNGLLCIHSVIIHGIIFWGSQPYSEKILKFKRKGECNHYKFKNERLM